MERLVAHAREDAHQGKNPSSEDSRAINMHHRAISNTRQAPLQGADTLPFDRGGGSKRAKMTMQGFSSCMYFGSVGQDT